MNRGLTSGICFASLFLFSVLGQKLTNTKVLDPATTLSWEAAADSITIELQAKASGYVGFGISPTGLMEGAYIVIGWMNGATPEFHHGRSTGHVIPTWSNPPKGYSLLSLSNTANVVTLRFRRTLTAENPGDYPIKPGPMTFIFAHHPVVPADRNSIEQHAKDARGSVTFALIP